MLQIQPTMSPFHSRSPPSPAVLSCSRSCSCALSPLASPQSHRLSVLLQFRNQPVALLDDVRVLLILVVRPVRFYNLVDAVDGAGYAVCCDEFC